MRVCVCCGGKYILWPKGFDHSGMQQKQHRGYHFVSKPHVLMVFILQQNLIYSDKVSCMSDSREWQTARDRRTERDRGENTWGYNSRHCGVNPASHTTTSRGLVDRQDIETHRHVVTHSQHTRCHSNLFDQCAWEREKRASLVKYTLGCNRERVGKVYGTWNKYT